jgi:hypothetical protein
MDKLNYSVVEEKLSTFDANCESLYNAIKDMDESITEAIESSNGAIFGDLGKKLLSDWDDNCSIFLNFRGLFDEWHAAAVDICVSNANFEEESKDSTVQAYTGPDFTRIGTGEERDIEAELAAGGTV